MSSQATHQPSQIGASFGHPIPALFLVKPYLTESLELVPNPELAQTKDLTADGRDERGGKSLVLSPVDAFSADTLTLARVTPKARRIVENVLSRIDQAQLKAETIEDREAYQLAGRVVCRAFYDSCLDAYNLAFCWMYGAPQEVIAYKVAHYEAFMLGNAWPERRKKPVVTCGGSALQVALPPKKPVQSMRAAQLAKGASA